MLSRFQVAGEVVAVGADVNTASNSGLQWKEGDRVCGLANGGGPYTMCTLNMHTNVVCSVFQGTLNTRLSLLASACQPLVTSPTHKPLVYPKRFSPCGQIYELVCAAFRGALTIVSKHCASYMLSEGFRLDKGEGYSVHVRASVPLTERESHNNNRHRQNSCRLRETNRCSCTAEHRA